MLLELALQKIKPQLEMMLKQGQTVVLLLSQTSLVKQQLIPKVTLLSQQVWLELGLVQVLKQRTLVLQLMLMATSLQRQISMSITNPIVKALQLQKLFKFLEISTFGRVATFSTLLPGITGIGGAGFQAKPGFILENGTYTPVQFISDLGPTFDYSNYNAFPFSLTK